MRSKWTIGRKLKMVVFSNARTLLPAEGNLTWLLILSLLDKKNAGMKKSLRKSLQ